VFELLTVTVIWDCDELFDFSDSEEIF
jgi:hypothetical protein